MTMQLFLILVLLSNGIHSSYSSPGSIKQSRRQARQLSTSKCICGVENNYSKLQRIVAGTEIKPELRFPWLLPLAYRNGSFFCAGTLINSRYVLTSAHCFRYSKQDAVGELRYMISSDAVIVPERITSNMLVGLGVHNLQNDDFQPPTRHTAETDKIRGVWLPIDYAIIHRFYENYDNAILHDIALIRLRKELNFERFRWLRPICLPDPEQFELEPFNKFQLEQYIQPNIVELNNPASQSNPLNPINPINANTPMSVNQLVSNIVNAGSGGLTSGPSSGTIHGLNDLINRFNAIGGMGNQGQHSGSSHQISNQLANQLASLMQDQLFRNGTSAYSSDALTFKEHFNPFLPFNDTRMERINSKRMNIERLSDFPGREGRRRFGRREIRNDKFDDGKFFAAGWGSTERNVWKLSKVPLWMQLKMLTRHQCIEKNGERVKWNYICAGGMQKEQETTVGDSGGPLFGEMPRKGFGKLQSMKNKPITSASQTSNNKSPQLNAPVSTTKSTSAPRSTMRTTTSTLKPASSSSTTTTAAPSTTTATTVAPSTTPTTQRTTILAMTATTEPTTTEKQVVKYITKPPLKFKFLSKRPQVQAQQQTSNEMNALLTKVKENTNRHFYSSMIYEDLFKTHNLPHDDLSRLVKEGREEEDEKESRDFVDGEEPDADNEDKNASTRPPDSTVPNDPAADPITDELDLSKNNYVQLGITSWSSYLNPEIGMYTDVRAYLGWIRRNTQDAHYCITDPAKLNEDKIPLPTTRPDTPDANLNLDCGAEKLNKINYPWLVTLYLESDKFLGNCVYFYSNFVICSDIYAEQSHDINQLAGRFTVEFYYPSRRFKVKNIVNRLMGSSTTINRREYIVLLLDDPDGQLPHHEQPGRKYNRASIDAQINKNNPQAACISTKDYPMNEESSNLVTFYLFAPGENLIRTQLKLTQFRKCKQLAPSFVTRRLLCAQVGKSEEVSISDHFAYKKQDYPTPNRLEAPSSPTGLPAVPATLNSTSFASKLKNFFRLPAAGLFAHYSNMNLFKEHSGYDLSRGELEHAEEFGNSTAFEKAARALEDTGFKELLDGQPVFHRVDNQYTLVGFLVKAPFPSTLAFKHHNLILMLDLKKFRFQVVTKLIKLMRTVRA